MEEKCLVEETSVDYGESSAFMKGDPNQMLKNLHVKTKKMLGKPLGVIDYGNDCGVVVNTDLKHLVNNHTNQNIVIKEIPVDTSIETVCAVVSEFGVVVLIKIQSVRLWQKAIITLGDFDQADLLASKDEFKALFYTFLVGTNAHDLWDFIGLVSEKTCVIKCNSVNYTQTHCTTVCFEFESNLNQALANTPVIKGSAPVSCPLAFGEKTWALVVGSILSGTSFGYNSQLGSIENSKPFFPVVNDLEKHLVSIESSLVSLVEQIGKLAKRLKSFMLTVSQLSPGCQLPVTLPLQNQGEDIVMGMGLSDATSDKTAAISGSTALPEVVKLENMLEGLSALVMSLSAHLDGLALAGGASSLPLSQ
ncbi:hypothetical protein G9A89_011338 [Geosiphon pyriformis]|nr:hypothetical protein G9A89_011338 [Geosiphon pyriformis]